MGFLSHEEVAQIGFKSVGHSVQISSRAVFYEPERQIIGDLSRIDDFCIISGRVEIGRNVHIAVGTNVAGGKPGVFLSDFSGLAYGCQVFSQSDDYSGETLTNPTVPDEFKNPNFAPVFIGRHALLGASCTVFPGVSISDGCAFASLSAIHKDTEPWGIYGGNPLRYIKPRSQNLLELESRYLKSLIPKVGKE